MDTNKNLGNNLRYYRKLRDMTLKEMAAKVDLSWSTYQKYETGQIKHVDIDIVKACAKALDVEPSVLLGWDSDNEDEKPLKITLVKSPIGAVPKHHKDTDIKEIREQIAEIYTPTEATKALHLYRKFQQAPPHIQAAIQNLLGDPESES